MDSSAYRNLGNGILGFTVCAIVGIVALVVGLGWLFWMAVTTGGWWAYMASFVIGWAAHAWACVLSGES